MQNQMCKRLHCCVSLVWHLHIKGYEIDIKYFGKFKIGTLLTCTMQPYELISKVKRFLFLMEKTRELFADSTFPSHFPADADENKL